MFKERVKLSVRLDEHNLPWERPQLAAPARDGDSTSPNWRGNWARKTYAEPASHGREFTKEEIGRTTPISSRRLSRSPKRRAFASAFTRTTAQE